MKVMLNTNSLYSSQNKKTAQKPLFKGNPYEYATGKLADGFAALAKNPKMVNFIDGIAKHNVISTLAATTGVVNSAFYMYNTAKSKKIEPEHKKPLIINMGLVTAMATAGALLLDKIVDTKIEQYQKFFELRNPNMDPKVLKACKGGIRGGATLLIFTLVYRYASPVIATPLANKAYNYFFGKKEAKKVA